MSVLYFLFSIMWLATIPYSSLISSTHQGVVSCFVFPRITNPKHILFVSSHSTIYSVVTQSGDTSLMYDASYIMTRVPFIMDVYMSFTSSGMQLICRRCPSGSLVMIPSIFFCSWGFISGVQPSSQTSTYPLLFTKVVVVLVKTVLGRSTGTRFFCTFLFGGFLYVILGHIGTIYPLFVCISGLILDIVTSRILCEAGVYILPVVRSGIILFSLSSPGWSSILLCPSQLIAPQAISIGMVVLGHQLL